MAPVRKSEEQVGVIWDRCFIDTSIKAAGGTLVGSIISVLFFKRKAWPITLGVGVGLGAGYTNCRHHLWWHRFHQHSSHGHFGHHAGHSQHHAHPPFWRGPGFRGRAPSKEQAKSDDKKPYRELTSEPENQATPTPPSTTTEKPVET